MVWLLIGYMWLFIHRPFEVWPRLGDFRIELIYMLVTGAVWAFHPGKRWPSSPIHWGVIGFSGAVVLCWLASAWSMDVGVTTLVLDYLKVSVFYLLVVTSIHKKKELRQLCAAFLCIMTLYMLHSLREYRLGRHIYAMEVERMVGVDILNAHPNDFATSIVYALPMTIPFWFGSAVTKSRKCLLLGYAALSYVCIILTGSRTGFVGGVLFAAVAVLFHPWRWRVMALAALLVPVLWLAVPAALQNRFETIVNPEVGPENARKAAEGRILGFKTGFSLIAAYPATGCGPGAWRLETKSKIEAHNLYGQLMGEMGAVGCLAFTGLLTTLTMAVLRIRRMYTEHPYWSRDFLYYLTHSLALTYFMMLALGNFGHNLFRFTWLWYGAFLVVIVQVLVDRARAETFGLAESYPGVDQDLTHTEPSQWTYTPA